MRKHLLFSVMLSLCAMGGMMVYPTPAIATVAQSPAIKVRGQVIDEQGEPLTGATVRIKGGQGGTITDVDGNLPKQRTTIRDTYFRLIVMKPFHCLVPEFFRISML